ncbi:MAG: Ig-like domain-containing protein [Candidatus Kerfeldbacteria bacterium]|nr:Ig-like domain-containing protein [Candidatus Kerfeldbacteria bacterium]
MRRSHFIFSLVSAVVFALGSRSAFAQVRTNFTNIGLSSTDPVTVILNILAWFLGIVALIALGLTVYGGFLWMTSGGNEEKVEKAKQVLRNAIIGLLIILSAWGIVLYVIGVFSDATGTSTTNGNGTGGSCIGCSIPSSGDTFGVLSTNPTASETNVVLCTDVTVRMTDAVDQSTVTPDAFFMQVVDGRNAGAACTQNTECSSGLCSESLCQGDVVAGTIGFAPGESTSYFNFVPTQTFEQDTTYEVTVAGGADGVLSLDTTDDGVDDSLSMGATYTWQFTTGSETDTTPPTVEVSSSSPYPADGTTNVCLYTVINFDFSEPMRITTFNDDLSFVVDKADDGLLPDWADAINLTGWSFGAQFDYAQARPQTSLEANAVYGARLYAGDPLNNFAGALTDSCGNSLDGNANGVSEGSTIDNYLGYDNTATPEDPITWTTGENAECTPIVNAFTPASDYYGEYAGLRAGDACSVNSDCGSGSCVAGVCQDFGATTLSITGLYLGPHPEVLMEGSQIFAGDGINSCFNEEHIGNNPGNVSLGDSCIDDELQSDSQIVMRTPVGAATSTPISVTVAGETSEQSSTELTVLSPYISALSPNNGSVGQYVTVVGANFIDEQGGGFVRMISADGTRVSTLTIPEACGDVWTDGTIIISAPETYTNTDGTTGSWESGDVGYVQVRNANGRYSDLQEFTFNTISRPNLCQVVSSCDNSGGQDFYVTGDNFGVSKSSNDQVTFASGDATGYYASVSSADWTSTQIDGTTPSDMAQDDYWVSVYDGDTGENSNTVPYSIPCSAAPEVVDIGTCSPDDSIYPVPNPRPDSTDVCINADVAVLFDTTMYPSSITTDTVYLEELNRGDEINSSYSPLTIVGRISNSHWSAVYGSNTYHGFKYDVISVPIDEDQDGIADGRGSSAHLRPNTWYRLTITTGVQSEERIALSENYTMTFKTRDSSELCDVSTIAVDPSSVTKNSYWDSEANTRVSARFSGSPYTASCQLLDADSYDWDWSIDNTSVGDFGTGPDSTSNQSVYVAGNDAENEGTARVTADVSGITDTSNFVVDLGYCDTDADCSSCSGSVCNESTHECTPVITDISPDNGDNGTWVTVAGCMFGSARGSVNMLSDDGSISTPADWPNEALCGDTWTNESVVVEVPAQYDTTGDGLDDAELPSGLYHFSIALPSGLSYASSLDYTLDDSQHPGLCLIDPNEGGEGAGFTAYGQGFGTDVGSASFNGTDDYNGDGTPDRVATSDANTSWTDAVINSIVPSGAVTGRAVDGQQGFVVIGAGGDPNCTDDSCSNALDFTVSCTVDADCASGTCDESGMCVPNDGTTSCTTDADCQVGVCGASSCSSEGTCTPVITSIDGDSGPNGAFTTVQGCYFGNYASGSAITFTNDAGVVSTGTFPCTDSWSDSQVIIEIPEASELPLGTTADVRVTTSQALTSNAEVFTVTNVCSTGAPVPSSGVPLLCDLIQSSGDSGSTVEFVGDRQVSSGQSDTFYNNADGDDFQYTDATSSTVAVPENAVTGNANVVVNSCASNGLAFTVTCSSTSDCGEGAYCVDNVCTADIAATCGACTTGTSDAVCGTSQGCYYNSGETAFCCGARPQLESISIENGAENICPNTEIIATFSEGIDNYDSAITLQKVVDNGDGTYTTVATETISVRPTDENFTTFALTPDQLDVSSTYLLTLQSSADASSEQLNSTSTGLALQGGTQQYLFSTASSMCVPDHIDLLNDETGESSYTFSEANATTDFTAYMLSSDNQYLASTDEMSWEFVWDPYYDDNRCDNVAWVDTTSEEDATGESSATSETQTIQSGDEHDRVDTITATASALSGWTGDLSDAASVATFYCPSGEAWQYIDETDGDGYVSHAYPQHFRLIYCDNDTLPTLNAIVDTGSAEDDWFLQYLFVSEEDKEDAFGIRVYQNSERLSPAAWYAANVPNPGSVNETTVDGYEAIQDGTSYYIAASNIDDDTNGDGLDELYDNIYLITFNESDNMSAIASQIMEHIRFNWNLSYAACEGSDKEKLVRDTKRITDIGAIASLANTYYAANGEYPLPQSESFGSYISSLTTSVWTSWQGALGNILGSTLPADPYNFFYASDADDPWNASSTPWEYTGDSSSVEDCAYNPDENEFYDEVGTCWDPINSKFFCPAYSHTYLWAVDPTNQNNASLYASMEYDSSTTETYITDTTVTEPCSSADPDSTCSCFNYVLSSDGDPGGTWR